jgi:hypothetical protein
MRIMRRVRYFAAVALVVVVVQGGILGRENGKA